jgi:chromate transporter
MWQQFALAFWLKLGFTSVGGPAAQIAAIEQEAVQRRFWLSPEQFSKALGLCLFLPGPEAQQLVAWVAWRQAGWRAAAAATLLFILPGLLLTGGAAWLYFLGQHIVGVENLMLGARAAIAGIIITLSVNLIKATAIDPVRRGAAAISLVSVLFSVPFAFIAVVAGAYAWFIRPDDEAEVAPISVSLKEAVQKTWKFLLPVFGLFLLLWAIFGHAHGIVQLSEVSLLAVLTSFGGAYAALNLWRGRAEGYHWMPEGNFGDALVAGEIMPGPLLLAGSFVGVVAGLNGLLIEGHPYLGAVVGLLLPAIFTFVPSTLIILGFAHMADEGIVDARFHDVIGMIAAVASGAILALGLTLLTGGHNALGFNLIVAGFIAALKYKTQISVPWLVGLGAIIGWFLHR